MNKLIMTAIAFAAISTSSFALDLSNSTESQNVEIAALETTPVKKTKRAKGPKQAEMLAIVCPSKAIKSEKLQLACDTFTQIASMNFKVDVTVKAPTAELKIIYANREFFK